MKRIRVRRIGWGADQPIDAVAAGYRVAYLAVWGDLGACATCQHLQANYQCARVGFDLRLRGMDLCRDYLARRGRPRRPKHDLSQW